MTELKDAHRELLAEAMEDPLYMELADLVQEGWHKKTKANIKPEMYPLFNLHNRLSFDGQVILFDARIVIPNYSAHGYWSWHTSQTRALRPPEGEYISCTTGLESHWTWRTS